MAQQSLNPACFGNRQPSADGSFVDIEGLGYKDFWPSLLMQRHRPKPTPLTDFPKNTVFSHLLMLKKVAQIAQLSVAFTITAFVAALFLCASITDAQPGGKKGDKGGKGSSETVDEFVAKLMAFNTAKDGKLTKTELNDTRLHALFARADTKKNGYITRADLEALFQREKLEGGGIGPFGDKGDKGGNFGDKKGKGFKGGPQPGVVLGPFVQDALNLTDAQRKQIAELQKEVDAKLDKILTAEQREELRKMSTFMKGFGDKKGPPPEKK